MTGGVLMYPNRDGNWNVSGLTCCRLLRKVCDIIYLLSKLS